MTMTRPATALTAVLCLFSAACGYHTAGKAVTIPENVRTIAIPSFVNQTETYKIEQTLTAAVVREMVTRTHYRIVNQASDAADATLHGTVTSIYTSPLTYDSHTGRAASVLVVVAMKVSLTDKQENVCPHSQKLGGPGWTIRPVQSPLLAPDFPLIFDVDQQDAAGDIEYGRDASLMMWNRKPHATERSTRPATISTCCG